MRSFAKFCLILLAGSIPAACSDKADETPEYKTPEGLHITTFPEAYKYQYVFSRNVKCFDHLLFYSDTFPVETLEGATIAMVPISENQIIGFGLYDYGIYPDQDPYTTSTVLTKTCFISTEKSEEGIPVFPDCGESGTLFNIFFFVPDDGSYDMYFRIENPEKNLYYQTPAYRYTVDTDQQDRYRTLINPINQ